MAAPKTTLANDIADPRYGELNSSASGTEVIYWHRDLPPVAAEAIGEHTVEANSLRIPGTFTHRDELWERCYEDLMVQARLRLQQEVVRLRGNYAHVLNEFVDSQHDETSGANWLHGRFSYMLYRNKRSLS